MLERPRNLVVLGSTGSIGRSTLEVVEAAGSRFGLLGLTAHRQFGVLCEQARRHRPRWVVATDRRAAADYDWSGLPTGTDLRLGPEAIQEIVAEPDVDVVVAAIVGSAGLLGTWAAIAAGKMVALANKETLVAAGPLVMELAVRTGARVLPVDSEHSALFQAMRAGRREEVQRVILTASGGPFRNWETDSLANVSVSEALAHPTWEMGPKISIDSATMMNKALEVIEARWLFDLRPEQIEVVIHPQSIVHSAVEFRDGSVIAQLSPPDMKLPIQYALTYPERWSGPAARLDLTQGLRLDFEAAHLDQYPALGVGYDVARAGGTAGVVLNAANEAAVVSFLEGRLAFTKIVPACRSVLERHAFDAQPTLERLLELDSWAREEVARWVGT